jgi:hypothetical protein
LFQPTQTIRLQSRNNQQILTRKQANDYKVRCENVYTENFKKKVAFKSKLTLKRPSGVKPAQFKQDLYEMLIDLIYLKKYAIII